MADAVVNLAAPPAPPATRGLRPVMLMMDFAALDGGGNPVVGPDGTPVVVRIHVDASGGSGVRRSATTGYPESFRVPSATIAGIDTAALITQLRALGCLP